MIHNKLPITDFFQAVFFGGQYAQNLADAVNFENGTFTIPIYRLN